MSDALRDAAQQALAALEMPCDRWTAVQSRIVSEVITRLRAVLAQAGAGREPVAWQLPGSDSIIPATLKAWRGALAEQWTIPLYAHPSPAQREPLSDAEVTRLSDLPECWGDGSGADFLHVPFARQIEAACAAAWGVKLADSGTTSGTKGAARTDDTAPAAGERGTV